MDEYQAREARRRRRDFIRAHHPDRGGDPEVLIAGLRAFGSEPAEDSGPSPVVVVVRRRAWLIRRAAAAVRRLRYGPSPPRVR
jgi:hypothetical protein